MLSKSLLLFFFLFLSTLSHVHAEQKYKVLHVMSYHASWKWNIDQLNGFKSGVGGLPVEYSVFELDSKRHSDLADILIKVQQANEIVQSWKPDLIYVNDDNAMKYFVKDYIDKDVPIVFSGVNAPVSDYGMQEANNITGVQEFEHFIPSINLLKSLSPKISKVALIIDNDPFWTKMVQRILNHSRVLDNVDVSEVFRVETFDEYKEKLKSLDGKVDAIAMLGVFNFKGSDGKNVSYLDVHRWTVENSRLPDFSFWESRVEAGTLGAVTVSGFEQGFLAGQMARKILKHNVSPSSLDITESVKGELAINITRAQQLGLMVDVELLLNSNVKSGYVWE